MRALIVRRGDVVQILINTIELMVRRSRKSLSNGGNQKKGHSSIFQSRSLSQEYQEVQPVRPEAGSIPRLLP